MQWLHNGHLYFLNKDSMKITDQLKSSYVEHESLDDLLEIMQDNWLLSKKWKTVRSEIWEETEHNKWHIQDPLERSWLSLTAYHKNYLIAEAKKWGLNKRACQFVLSKTDEMQQCYDLSIKN